MMMMMMMMIQRNKHRSLRQHSMTKIVGFVLLAKEVHLAETTQLGIFLLDASRM